MSRGKLYAVVGSLGVMAVVAAVALTLVFSRDGSSSAGSSPEPVAAAVGLAQASGEMATSSGGLAKALPQGGPVSESGLEAVAAPAPSGGGPSEGIQVHGHWTIEVREPDGTLVSRTEFENALASGGAGVLQDILFRNASVGWWAVLLRSLTTGPCPVFVYTNPVGVNAGSNCVIAEASSPLAGAGVFKTLSLSAPTTGPDAFKVVFAGNATAQQTGLIEFVETGNQTCLSTVAPSAPCTSLNSPRSVTVAFAGPTTFTAVNVLAGQQILVTVRLSFA